MAESVGPDDVLDEMVRELGDIDVDEVASEEARAARRLSSIEAGRRKGGAAGAAMAGAMLAVSEIYEGPPKDDAPITVEASGEPGDIDEDGIEVSVDDTNVWAPPPPPRDDPPDNGARV
jgi:hypothetical protein